MSLGKAALGNYVASQLNVHFPDNNPVGPELLESYIQDVLEWAEYCFSFVNNRYFLDGDQVLFNHLHADQYAMFLYMLSHALWKERADTSLCEKLFYLNKSLHGIDAFYSVVLPEIFLFVHPLGTVLGKATYANFFMVYQRCGVGSNKGIYPELGEYVTLHPGASVLGNCRVGRNCGIAAGALLLDASLEDNTLYIGNPLSHITRTCNEKPAIWRQTT